MKQEINYLEKFNPKYHYFGSLCFKEHNHKDGQSIRYKTKDHNCIQCTKEKHKGPIIEKEYGNQLGVNYLEIFDEQYHYFGELCIRKHDHKNGQSIRYKNKANNCIQCIKEYNFNNKQIKKEWEQKNKEYLIEYRKNYRKENKIKIDIYEEKRRKDPKHIESRKAQDKKSWQKPETKIRHNFLTRKRRKEDPKVRLRDLMSVGIRKSLKNKKANITWTSLVDYDLDVLETHLNQFKTEEKQDLEHIIPESWFIFEKHTDLEFKLCWALKNLQYLEHVENRWIKNSKYAGCVKFQIITFKEFEDLLNYYSITLLCNIIWNEYYSQMGIKINGK